MRLPNAPPRISDSPNRASRSWNAELRAYAAMATSASAAIADHDRRLVGKVGRVQQAERGARVLHVREVEQARDDVDRVVERQHLPDDQLRELIDGEHGRGW